MLLLGFGRDMVDDNVWGKPALVVDLKNLV